MTTTTKAPPKTKADLIDSLPSADAEAERCVIGSALLLPEVLDDLAPILSEHDFLTDDCRAFYRHMLTLHNAGKRVDPKLILESMRRGGQAIPNAATLLGECAESVFTAANARHYAMIVRDRAIRQAIHSAGVEIVQCSHLIQDGEQAVNRVEEVAFAIRDKHRCGVERITDAAGLLQTAMDDLDARESGKGRVQWSTGFDDLDKIVSLRPGEMVILAARPSMGKSALGLNIAVNVAKWEQVLFVSLEMSNIQLADRLIAAEAEVDTYALQGALNQDQRKRVVEAAASLSSLKLSVDDSPTRTVTEIAAVARRQKRKHGLAVLVVDYLQLIAARDAKSNREQQVAEMSRSLKAIARELNVCVLCLAQLNRQNETAGNRRPTLSNLRESGAIEQDADVVMFIHREDYYMSREDAEKANVKGIAEVIVRKQRQGPVGDCKLLWQAPWTRFVSLAKHPIEDHPNFHDEFGDYSN